MIRSPSQLVASFFVACLLALQFHPVGEPQSEHNDKPISHLEEVSNSLVDKSIDNRFINVQQFLAKQSYLSGQSIKPKQQRQDVAEIGQQVAHPFRHFMLKCLVAICQSYEDKLVTSFHYLKKRELSFELDPFIAPHIMQLHPDGPDAPASSS